MVVNMVWANSGAHAPVTAPESSSWLSDAWHTAGALTRIAVFMSFSMVAIITPCLVIRWIVDLSANPHKCGGSNVFERGVSRYF